MTAVVAPAAQLVRADFASFFAAMHDGHPPFAWQERLLDSLLESRRWPERIAAPTGAGKTSVIDVHVFALALTAGDPAVMPPRRLAMVVDRRVLVDDQHTYALALADALAAPSSDVLHRVAERLSTMQVGQPDRQRAPLVVGRLRGGAPPSRTWRDNPTAPAIVCGTPAMWGSRLLFRGYGSSSNAWPREAGMLAFDSAVIIDEAHLTPQLLVTARRVAALAIVAEEPLSVAPLQVVETTATPGGTGGTEVQIAEADLDIDQALRRRLTTPKPVRRIVAKNWAMPGARPAVDTMVDAVRATRSSAESIECVASRTVGCFVNTVARAVAVADALRKRGLTVAMVCGQARPIDVRRLDEDPGLGFPGLLGPRGNDDVDVLVSTQSLEVGVDLDLAAVVTDLASGPALAQRAGRVNRRGLRGRGPITVIGPDEVTDRTRSGPYGPEQLRDGWAWLDELGPDGLTPWSMREHVPRQVTGHRLHQRPELAQAWHWARTSDDLHAEPELDLWLSEDLDADLPAGLVVRRDLPDDPTVAVEMLRLLRPRQHEVFGVPLAALLDALTSEDRPAAYVVRDDVEVVEFSVPSMDEPRRRPRLRPGDIVVVDAALALFTTPDRTPPVLVPGQEPSTVARHPAPDVLEEELSFLSRHQEAGAVVGRWDLVEPSGNARPGMEALRERLRGTSSGGARTAFQEWLRSRPSRSVTDHAVLRLLNRRVADSDVQVIHADDGPAYVVVVDRRRISADEEVRQVWTASGERVLLADHQSAVGERAASLGRGVGVGGSLEGLLDLAGRHHDDGKQDSRFQVRLGADEDGPPLAKSRPGTTVAESRRLLLECGLPGGWRHEQRSVVDSWGSNEVSGCSDPELVARLVGTSHGRGRSGFPHAAVALVGNDPVAIDLFDHGRWDELIERTHIRYGVWGCAYLEALLRAADGQISREGG